MSTYLLQADDDAGLEIDEVEVQEAEEDGGGLPLFRSVRRGSRVAVCVLSSLKELPGAVSLCVCVCVCVCVFCLSPSPMLRHGHRSRYLIYVFPAFSALRYLIHDHGDACSVLRGGAW